MMDGRYTIKIGGEAGFGIMSAGLTLSKIAARSGYYIFDYAEYPSIIRGGHNVTQTTISKEPVYSQGRDTHLLVALNQDTIDFHVHELVEGAGVIFDSEKGMELPEFGFKVFALDVPLDRIARETGGTILMRNTAALGAVMALTGGDLEILKHMIADEFGDKAKDIVERNHAVCEEGFRYVKEKFNEVCNDVLVPRQEKHEALVVTANDAVAMGAIAAGLQFASIYPMTPTSNILSILAIWQEKYGFVYKQPEDEIAAINMALGAAYAGARAMVATSGGGFCLMSEGYGLSGMTETPIVIIEGMRGSPATGLPTWTEQGDLRFVLHAHQGEFPRIVMAPGDAEEAFYMTMRAFNLAEKYQCPVVVLVDKHLCESHLGVKPFVYEEYVVERGKVVEGNFQITNYNSQLNSKDNVNSSRDEGSMAYDPSHTGKSSTKDDRDVVGRKEYGRYALSEDGISPRAFPGMGHHVLLNSDEHDEEGFSDETSEMRTAQMKKRMKKLEMCEKQDMPGVQIYGPADAPVTIMAWGSTKGVVLDALRELPMAKMLFVPWMSPFPTATVREVLEKSKYVVNVEGNYSAQFGGYVAEKTGIRVLDNLLKYDGRPFYVEEIVEKVKGIRY